MRRRWVRILVWGAVALLFLLFALGLVLRRTPLVDRYCERVLLKALARSGGTFTAEKRQGTLLSGLQLDGVKVVVPGRFEVTLRRLRVRLHSTPLLAGVFSAKNPSAEGLKVVVWTHARVSPEDASPPSNPIPPWLLVSVSGLKVEGALLEIRSAAAESAPTAVRGVSLAGDLSIAAGRLTLDGLRLSVREAPRWPGPLSAQGRLTWIPPDGLKGALRLRTPASSAFVTGSAADLATSLPELALNATVSPFALSEWPFWSPSAPDFRPTGNLSLSLKEGGWRWVSDLSEPALGVLRSKGSAHLSEGAWVLEGEVESPSFSLAPFWTTPPDRVANLSGSVRFQARLPETGETSWTAQAALGPSSVWGFPVSSANLQGRGGFSKADLEGTASSPLTGRGAFRLAWDGKEDLFRLGLSGDAAVLPEILGRLDLLPELPPPLRLPGDPLRAERLELTWRGESFHLEAEADDASGGAYSGTLSLSPEAPAAWWVTCRSVAPATWGLPGEGPWNFSARFEGASLERGRILLESSSSSWSGVSLGPFRSEVEVTDWEVFRLSPAESLTSLGSIGLKGSVGPAGRLDLEVRVREAPLGRWGNLWNVELAGMAEAEGTLQGEIEAPSVAGRIHLRPFSAWGFDAGSAEIRGVWGPGEKKVSADWRELARDGTVLGDGTLTFAEAGGVSRMNLRTGFGAGRAVQATAVGLLDGDHGDLRVDTLRMELEGRPFDLTAPGRVAWDSKSFRWEGIQLRRNQNSVATEGRFRYADAGLAAGLEARITAKHLPLRFLPFLPGPDTLTGFVTGELTWVGSLEDPDLQGELALLDLRLRIPDSDLFVLGGARMAAEGRNLRISESSLTTTEGGAATLEGGLEFRGLLVRDMSLRARGDDFPVVFGRDFSGTADFDVTLRGPLSRPVVEGTTRIVKGRIQLPELERMEPIPATIRFVNTPPGSPLAAASVPDELVGPLRGTLRIRSEGKLWATNRSLLAELAGELTLRMREDGEALEGSLDILQGRYVFQGLKFDLTESRIFFKGTTDWTPYLDLKARRESAGAVVTAHVTGPAGRPELGLSSSPPMEEGDILATLLFGRASEDLTAGENQKWGSAAAALAVQYQAGPLLDSVKKRLDLDAFQLGTDSSGAAQVGFSKFIGDRTVLEYRQTFGALPEGRLNLRYRINRHLSVQSESSTLGKSGLDLLWEQSY
ncbi:MAG: translocation/assembly module TamB domain-containing protein [Acidobacteriota bacterium]